MTTDKPPFGGEVVRLGDVCEVCSGGTPKRSVQKYWQDGSIPWVKISDIKSKHVDKTEEFITSDGLANSSAKLLPAGTILYSIFASIGAVGVLDIPATTNQAIAGIQIKGDAKELLEPDYLYHWLKAQESAAKASGRGVAQNNINLTILRNMQLRLPNKERQGQVVKHLETVERQNDLIDQQLAMLDELVKSRFVEMFGDGSWPVRPMGELATDIRYGTSKKASDEGLYTYLRMNNMTDDGRLDFSDTKRITLDGSELDKCLVRKGDLLFNRTNSREKVGKTAVFEEDEPMVIAGYIIRVRLGQDIRSAYLSAYMNLPHIKESLRAMAKGAVHQANINAKQLGSIQVPVPPIELQDEFISFASRVDKLRVDAQQQKDKLQTLYDSLAQEYFG